MGVQDMVAMENMADMVAMENMVNMVDMVDMVDMRPSPFSQSSGETQRNSTDDRDMVVMTPTAQRHGPCSVLDVKLARWC